MDARPDEPQATFDAGLVEAGSGGALRGVAPAVRSFWVAGGRVAELPPCATCATAALGPAIEVAPLLAPLRDALLGTIVATEIVKALLGLGTGLRGHVLIYDPESATFARTPVTARATCACSRGAAPPRPPV